MADTTSPKPAPSAPSPHRAERRGNFVTIQHAAEVCRVHPETIRRWVRAGRLTGYRTGPRLIRVNLDDVAALIVPTK
jgi:excisionase family DNA binding protein